MGLRTDTTEEVMEQHEYCREIALRHPVCWEKAEGYRLRRESTGDFLRELFSNRLVQAFGRADPVNRSLMHQWALYVYNVLPSRAWGSPEAVAAWTSKEHDP